MSMVVSYISDNREYMKVLNDSRSRYFSEQDPTFVFDHGKSFMSFFSINSGIIW